MTQIRMSKAVSVLCSDLLVKELINRFNHGKIFPIWEMVDHLNIEAMLDLNEKHIRGLVPKAKKKILTDHDMVLCNKRKMGYFISEDEKDIREEFRKSAQRSSGHIGSAFITSRYLLSHNLELDPEKNLDDDIVNIFKNANIGEKLNEYRAHRHIADETRPEPMDDPEVNS